MSQSQPTPPNELDTSCSLSTVEKPPAEIAYTICERVRSMDLVANPRVFFDVENGMAQRLLARLITDAICFNPDPFYRYNADGGVTVVLGHWLYDADGDDNEPTAEVCVEIDADVDDGTNADTDADTEITVRSVSVDVSPI